MARRRRSERRRRACCPALVLEESEAVAEPQRRLLALADEPSRVRVRGGEPRRGVRAEARHAERRAVCSERRHLALHARDLDLLVAREAQARGERARRSSSERPATRRPRGGRAPAACRRAPRRAASPRAPNEAEALTRRVPRRSSSATPRRRVTPSRRDVMMDAARPAASQNICATTFHTFTRVSSLRRALALARSSALVDLGVSWVARRRPRSPPTTPRTAPTLAAGPPPPPRRAPRAG